MRAKSIIAILAVMSVNASTVARVCPPPPPTGTGDYVDDCIDVFRIECPAQDRVLTGFRVWVDGQPGIITALHGVVGCSRITAFNLMTSYRDLQIGKVDVARDTALLISSELDRAGEGLQFSNEYQSEELRIVGYPQALGYQFSHRVEPNLPALRPLHTTLPDAERLQLERRGSPDVGQTILSLSGAIQNGYSGAPILTWAGRVIGVANGGLRSGSVDIGWAMPIGQMRWENARMRQNELTKLSGGKPSALFGAQASPRSTLPTLYITDGGNNIGRIYEVRDGRLREIYARPRGRLYSVAIAPDGLFYFSNANDYEIYRLDKGREIKVYTHSTYTRDIEFDAEGRLYFSEATGASSDGIIYRLQNGRATPHFKVRLSDVGGFWAGGFAFDGMGTLWLSNGNRVPAALYKVEKGQLQRVFTAATSITGFTFSADGDLLYADHRQRIQRIELPGFLTSEAVHAPNFKWITDVAGFGRRKVSMTPGALPSVSQSKRQVSPSSDWIEVISAKPASGSILPYGRSVVFDLRIRYSLQSANEVRLVVSVGQLPASARDCKGKGGSLVDANETVIKRGSDTATVRVKWAGGARSKNKITKGYLSFYPSLWQTKGYNRIAYFGRTPGYCYPFG